MNFVSDDQRKAVMAQVRGPSQGSRILRRPPLVSDYRKTLLRTTAAVGGALVVAKGIRVGVTSLRNKATRQAAIKTFSPAITTFHTAWVKPIAPIAFKTVAPVKPSIKSRITKLPKTIAVKFNDTALKKYIQADVWAHKHVSPAILKKLSAIAHEIEPSSAAVAAGKIVSSYGF